MLLLLTVLILGKVTEIAERTLSGFSFLSLIPIAFPFCKEADTR